jgi:hypothetical protein
MKVTAMQFVVWVETMIAAKSVAVQRAAVVERQRRELRDGCPVRRSININASNKRRAPTAFAR